MTHVAVPLVHSASAGQNVVVEGVSCYYYRSSRQYDENGAGVCRCREPNEQNDTNR